MENKKIQNILLLNDGLKLLVIGLEKLLATGLAKLLTAGLLLTGLAKFAADLEKFGLAKLALLIFEPDDAAILLCAHGLHGLLRFICGLLGGMLGDIDLAAMLTIGLLGGMPTMGFLGGALTAWLM